MLEDSNAIGPGDTVKTVEQHTEFGILFEEGLDKREVEDLFHVLDVVDNAVDDLNLEGTIGLCSDF